MSIPFPTGGDRWDDFFIESSDASNNVVHTHGGYDSQYQFSESWGGWADPRYEPKGAWDSTGTYLTVEVRGADGSKWGKCVDVNGNIYRDWFKLTPDGWAPPAVGSPTYAEMDAAIAKAVQETPSTVTQAQVDAMVKTAINAQVADAAKSAITPTAILAALESALAPK